MTSATREKPDYGVDAPAVLRNFFLIGGICLVLAIAGPRQVHVGPVIFILRPMFNVAAIILLAQGCLYLLYVKFGKLRHRDRMLALYSWRGDEHVLDVGCGRGLLLAGAAKRLSARQGSATGIDVWSTADMGGNTEEATRRNLRIEGVDDRCRLVTIPAQDMPFADASFDLVLSNLCLHNIYNRAARRLAVQQIARVLKTGGTALISDYKHTREYAEELRRMRLEVRRVWGLFYAFPPLRIVVARKTASPAV